MKRILIFTVMVLLISSCNMKQYCHDRYPPETITEIKVEEKTIYRDTVIYVEIKPDTVHQTDTIIEVEGLLQSIKLYGETEYCQGWAQVINGLLLHEITQKESKIEKLLQTKEKETIKTEYVQVKVEVPTDLSWWQQTMIRGGYVLLGLIVLVIVGIIIRKKIPFL